MKAINKRYTGSILGQITMRQYYEDNKEYFSIINKEYADAHTLEKSINSALYYDKNKEKIKERIKAYQEEHKNEISLTKALKHALDSLQKKTAEKEDIDQEFIVKLKENMDQAEAEAQAVAESVAQAD
jgi:hypothetical protein